VFNWFSSRGSSLNHLDKGLEKGGGGREAGFRLEINGAGGKKTPVGLPSTFSFLASREFPPPYVFSGEPQGKNPRLSFQQ